MKYSVLMTVYKNDNPKYFRKSIMSMITQTKTPDEMIIVKDGPISGELQNTINGIDKKFPNIIRQVQLEENVGLGLALNEGLKLCRNDLVARMDADDISINTRCELQLKEFEMDNDLDIVGCSVDEFIDDEENVISSRIVPISNEDIHKFAKQRDPFNHPTVMYRKSKVLGCGGYSDLRKNQDTDLWIKMLSNGCKAKNLKESLVLFRFDENTYKRRKNWMNTKLLIKIRYNAFKIGFSSIGDLLKVSIIQLAIYILPIKFQKIIYGRFLRQRNT
ncbi:MAG: glycosyltransferase [Paraclostridium sordellii]